VVHGGGLLTSAREYAVAVMILAALAILGLARWPGRSDAARDARASGGTGTDAVAEVGPSWPIRARPWRLRRGCRRSLAPAAPKKDMLAARTARC
jgi:hypothetical protein